MTGMSGDDDDRLLGELGAALRHAGPVSERHLDMGEAALTWRTIDAELAALTYDSVLDDEVLVRRATAARTLFFEGRSLSVEIAVTSDGIDGQLLPPTPGEVTLLYADGASDQTSADETGCFSFAKRITGQVRLQCVTDTVRVVTDWVRI